MNTPDEQDAPYPWTPPYDPPPSEIGRTLNEWSMSAFNGRPWHGRIFMPDINRAALVFVLGNIAFPDFCMDVIIASIREQLDTSERSLDWHTTVINSLTPGPNGMRSMAAVLNADRGEWDLVRSVFQFDMIDRLADVLHPANEKELTIDYKFLWMHEVAQPDT